MARPPSPFAALGLGDAACRLLTPQWPEGPRLEAPIRSVLFGAARFSEHGRSLARAQEIAGPGEARRSFFPRLQENLDVLRDSRRLLEQHARQGHHLAPAAGWLIDHGNLLEHQLDTVRQGLPRRYFAKLPRLRDAPLAGLPRIYGLAWAWVAHTDSGLDEDLLELFLSAYQTQRELTLAELWAVPTTLRVVLVENLRRLAERAATVQAARDAAHRWIDQLPGPHTQGQAQRQAETQTAAEAQARTAGSGNVSSPTAALERLGTALAARGVLEAFALQLQSRADEGWLVAVPELRAWLTQHLPDPAGALQRQQQEEAEDHQSVRNAVTALRGLDQADWRGMLMRSSAALASLLALPVFAAEAEATQDLSLQDIERLARRAGRPESKVSAVLADLIQTAAPGPWPVDAGRPAPASALAFASAGAADADPALRPTAAGPRPPTPADAWAAAAAPACAAPQYWLRGAGRAELLRALGLHSPWRPLQPQPGKARLTTPVYLSTLALATAALVALQVRHAASAWPPWTLVVTALLMAWPASEAVVAVIHRLLSESLPPRRLPRLALAHGIPASRRTLVVMPVMLTGAAAIQALAEQLEQHWLANPEANTQFALLSDFLDAAGEHESGDAALLQAARAAVEQLNRLHPVAPGEPLRFLLLHRRRRWSASEACWMGWERKRGKLEQLLARLASPAGPAAADAGTRADPFVDLQALSQPAAGICSVVTLDSDTDMPPGRLRELAAIAAHPQNRPVVDAALRRVSAGYGILQPRLAVPLPRPGTLTAFHWLFSGQWGIDPYSAASSEIYQDLFAEGTFTGKGLLDVQAVNATLHGRLPEALVLSHDLLEGALARCAAVSDVTLVEDAPAHPEVAWSRLHRWTRGDWQLLAFVTQPRRWPMAGINRWKLVDNLRRSLVAPMSLLLLLWALAGGAALAPALWLVLAAYGAGPLLGAVAALAPPRDDIDLGLFFSRAGAELLRAVLGALWHLLQLPAQAGLAVDAIARALFRQFRSHQHLLQWKTAAAAQAAASTDPRQVLQRHRRLPIAAAAAFVLLVLARLAGAPVALGASALCCLLWAASPLALWLASRPLPTRAAALNSASRERVLQLAFDTWLYYQRYVGEVDNHLPPDNVQFTGPEPMVAHRTSPTNIGLYLLGVATARELGFIGVCEMTERIERTLATLDRLPRWRGHFHNWIDTRSLATLPPTYVSAVDSGNLSGHLLVLAAACQALAAAADREAAWEQGLLEALAVSGRQLQPLAAALVPGPDGAAPSTLAALLLKGGGPLSDAAGLAAPPSQPAPLAGDGADDATLVRAERELDLLIPHAPPESAGTLRLAARHLHSLRALQRDRRASAGDGRAQLRQRLLRLAGHARTLALAADFAALYDTRRHLLHIGYDVDHDRLDASHYDLLASESRLASLVAIGKGDLPPRHWSALGRPLFAAAAVGGHGVGLKSWSGSMFEYLMPTLVLAEPAGSLLHEATRAAVAAQRNDALRHGTPWGVSESAIAVRDHTLAYQYGPQGVASLALRRTPADERVVAPYASVMALLIAPQAAADNLAELQALGARRELGFIEALDYTPYRQPAAPSSAVAVDAPDRAHSFTPVETFMAHHQAMSLLACAHVLADGVVQRWAALSPHLRAVHSLLHERAPHVAPPLRVDPELPLQGNLQGQRWLLECQPQRSALLPTHLLGNERYAVMLRANGAGFSQWSGQALGRWRDDALRDRHGLFAYVRRAQESRWLSLSSHPAPAEGAEYRCEFHPDRAVLRARLEDLSAVTTVSVSSSDDCELRSIELYNPGRRPMRLSLALAFEPTLAPARADETHPAFSNLFLQAHWSDADRALFLQRKPRLAHEPALHAVFCLVACDDPLARVDACASRAQWLGRLGDSSEPAGLAGPQDAAAWVAGAAGGAAAESRFGSETAAEGAERELPTGLDPMAVISVELTVPPRGSVTLNFVLGAAAELEPLRALVDRYRQPASTERAQGLSDTLARIRLHELRLDVESWAAWLHLNTLLASTLTRPLSGTGETIDRRLLWRHGLGGERPILAVWIESPEGLALARQLTGMLALWTAAGLALDLVVVNAELPSYAAPLQHAFVALAEQVALRVAPQLPVERRATLHLIHARDLQPAEQATLRMLARVTLQADGRSLVEHVERLQALHEDDLAERSRVARRSIVVQRPDGAASAPEGRFEPARSFEAAGNDEPAGRSSADKAAFGFALSFSRYPSRPWTQVLANPDFGSLLTEAAGGNTWAGNSRMHQITAFANDPLCDPPVEALWLEDLDSRRLFWLGRGLGSAPREVLHGIGFTRMRQRIDGLDVELEWCVDAAAAVKQLSVRLSLPPVGGARVERRKADRNDVRVEGAIERRRAAADAPTATRRLRLVGYAEWTLGASRADRTTVVTRPWRWTTAAPRSAGDAGLRMAVMATQRDASGGHAGATAFLCWRPVSAPAVSTERTSWFLPVTLPSVAGAWQEAEDWTCDRREFFDRSGRWVLPARLRGRAGPGLDPCGAVACRIDVGPGRSAEAALLLGHADTPDGAIRLVQEASALRPAERLAAQCAVWPALLDAVQVATPDPLFDALVNRWLPYQAIACRLWARAGYYQAGGAYGFRDQLQDAMNLADRAPQLLHQQLHLHAARQFEEGDVQHWWHPPGGAGVRTRMSDDLLWLPLALAHALRHGAPPSLLDERVSFLHGGAVPPDREDLYATPAASERSGSLFEHGARAIDRSVAALDSAMHGLPPMGTGDWNDGMNRVGFEGRGVSIWLGWFLCQVIDDFAPWAERRAADAAHAANAVNAELGADDAAAALQRARRWRSARAAVAQALDREGWDGRWYRRAYFDDGSPLGSAANAECRIDLIAQAWATLSAAGDPRRARQALASTRETLWDPDAHLMRLLDPPLAKAEPSAGYIQAYPPGIRENGGQYNHAAVWALMAFARQGDAAWAWQLFAGMSPAHRSADPQLGPRYGLEPYVLAGDIYSQPPYTGRGGWSWYTGAASWLQRAAIESMCGLHLEDGTISLRPCLPPHWPQAELELRHQGRRWRVSLLRDVARWRTLLATNLAEGIQLEGRAPSASIEPTQGTAPASGLPLRPLPVGSFALCWGQAVPVDRLPDGCALVVLADPADAAAATAAAGSAHPAGPAAEIAPGSAGPGPTDGHARI